MEISPNWVSAAAAVLGVGSTIAGMWIKSAFSSRDELISSQKSAAKLLFDKFDGVNRDLQEYKLHVAESYVNQAALEKLLAPAFAAVERRLETIESDLRRQRDQDARE